MRATLTTPPRFSFRGTVLSHGWYGLTPFRGDERGRSIETLVTLPGGGALPIRLAPQGRKVRLEAPGRPAAAVRRHLVATARRVLNLDLDLREFHATARSDGRLRWIASRGAGRMLRCPTAFEDLVKLVLTTNCSWSLTRRMVDALVERCGAPAPDGRRAFPDAAAIARLGVRRLREQVRTGYRAPLLHDLACRVAAGRVDPAAWDADERPVDELKREMLELPGVGPYVAESLLKLIGRPSGLALDSWMRGKYARLYHGGRRVTDRTIARRYARFGSWAGLAVWCDLTRDWL